MSIVLSVCSVKVISCICVVGQSRFWPIAVEGVCQSLKTVH